MAVAVAVALFQSSSMHPLARGQKMALSLLLFHCPPTAPRPPGLLAALACCPCRCPYRLPLLLLVPRYSAHFGRKGSLPVACGHTHTPAHRLHSLTRMPSVMGRTFVLARTITEWDRTRTRHGMRHDGCVGHRIECLFSIPCLLEEETHIRKCKRKRSWCSVGLFTARRRDPLRSSCVQ